MTAKTSLFNKGIYKSTVKRYSWGSALYFIILFMFTGMSILLTVERGARYTLYQYLEHSYLLEGELTIIALLLTIAVPTIAGLLIFRFIHSKKTAVFVHSLPVRREANFISSIAAGLTLMIVPVILNTAILMILSVSGYGDFFTVTDCIIWLLFNIFGIFVMFSCVCFVASITGNSFAMIVLNVLMHTIILIIAACSTVVAEMFLHGFPNDNAVTNFVAKNIFPVRIMELVDYAETGSLSVAGIVVTLIVSVVFYVLSVILYKKRRMETAEDVAGFRCLNPIFKYLITFVSALIAFAAGYSFMTESLAVFWITILIVSAVVYFACEMVLKKTLRVWRSYKGYCVFAGVFAAGICLIAFTSFFGYETRIPDIDDVKSVAVYDYYSGEEEPFLENAGIIEKAVAIHHKKTEKRPVANDFSSYNYFHIKYKLKNGSVIHRRYYAEDKEFRDMMNSLYENQQYKEITEDIFFKNPTASYIYMYIHGENSVRIESSEKIAALMECIRADVSGLTYDQLYNNGWSFNVDYEYTIKGKDGNRLHRYKNYNINANYKNTIAWMKENGYWSYVEIVNEGTFYVVNEWEDLPFVKNGEIIEETEPLKETDAIELRGENAQKVIDYIHTEGQIYLEDDEVVGVYKRIGNDRKSIKHIAQIPKDALEPLIQ